MRHASIPKPIGIVSAKQQGATTCALPFATPVADSFKGEDQTPPLSIFVECKL